MDYYNDAFLTELTFWHSTTPTGYIPIPMNIQRIQGMKDTVKTITKYRQANDKTLKPVIRNFKETFQIFES